MNAASRFLLLAGTSLLAAVLPLPLAAGAETSIPAPLASRTLLLSVARAGDTLVAAGDQGNVVLSRDSGLTWQQALTPTRALLTAVCFSDAQHGWAVGHGGVILATRDGGLTWERQDDGRQSEIIWLDVLFLDAQRGFVAGAYGQFRITTDGGKTWISASPSPEEMHYNHLATDGQNRLCLTGEGGTLLLSDDAGHTWRRSELPYDGSLHGSLFLPSGELVTYGLRGHILRSPDWGETWVPEHSAVKVLIMAGLRLKSGVIVLAGQGGNFFVSHDSGQTFLPWKPAGFSTGVADLIETSDGQLLTVGEAGAIKVKLP